MSATTVEQETDSGPISGVLTRCIWCQDTRAEIEKAGEPMEDYNSPFMVAMRAEDAAIMEKIFKMGREEVPEAPVDSSANG